MRFDLNLKRTAAIGGVLLILMGALMLGGCSGQRSLGPSQAESVSTAATSAEAAVSPESAKSEVYLEDESNEAAEEAAVSEDQTGESGASSEKVYPAIDFDLKDQYGNRQQLSSYKGKVVFLNFWATWCPPCRAEMPDIQKLYEYYEAHPEENVVILGIAEPGNGQEQSEEGVIQFLEENGYTYPVAFDTEGRSFMNYAIMSIPTTYMIDADGNMFGYVSGAISEETMRSIIEQTKIGKR